MVKSTPIMNLVLRGVTVAMGVAAVVLSVLGTTSESTLMTMLGIGVFAIGVDALNRG